MSRSSRRILSAVLFAAPLLGAGAFCSSALASDPVLPGPESLTLSPSVQAVETQEAAAGQAASQDPAAAREPVYLDAAAPEAPNIHGFFDSPFKTSYTTPRGLVVFDHGVVWQPIVGLVFPLAFDLGPIKKPAVVAGIWNSVAMSQADPGVGGWEEMDVFVDVGGTVLDKVKVDLTFDDWNFPTSVAPPNKPKAEKNIELKGVYDDSDIWGKDSGFSVNPYVNGFFAVAGSSTVVLGRQGSTGYAELGVTPTYVFKGIENWPITLTLPTYCSVGPANYWGAGESGGTHHGNFGLFSMSLNGSVPLNFIPVTYGHWHAEAGVSYFYLANDNLLRAGTLISGNTNRNFVQGSVGIGVNF